MAIDVTSVAAEALFLRFLLLSLTGGAAALLLCLARPLLRRGPARWAVLLWVLLALRMLVPWGFALRAPLAEAPEATQYAAKQMIEGPAITIPNPASQAAASVGKALSLPAIAAMVWLAGAAAFAMAYVIGYRKEKRRMLQNAQPVPEAARRLLRELCAEIRLRREPSLLWNGGTQGPVTMGLRRPVILLPAKAYTPEELEFVLRHELCHLRHGDLRLKCLLLAVNALHWFNPALWLLRRETDAAMELACDERVVGGRENRRAAYSLALLSAAGRPRGASILTTGLNGGKCNMKEMKYRLRNILNTRKKRSFAAAIAVLLCAGLVVAAAGVGPGLVTRRKTPGQLPAADTTNMHAVQEEPTTAAPPSEEEPTTAAIEEEPATAAPEEAPETTAAMSPPPKNDGAKVEDVKKSKPAPSSSAMVWPVPACRSVSSAYGPNTTFNRKGFHRGIDIADGETKGKKVVAAKGGVVEIVQLGGSSYGNMILIDHGNGVKTRYAHLMSGSVTVRDGDTVRTGQTIARVGSTGNTTGPNLHFEVQLNSGGEYVCVDPLLFVSP